MTDSTTFWLLSGSVCVYGISWKNRSLWLDEAYVATRIIGRSWQEILNDTPMFPSQPKEPLIFFFDGKVLHFRFGKS
jgi:hypothetical protein